MKLRSIAAQCAVALAASSMLWSSGATAASIVLGTSADTYLRDETIRGGFAFMDVRGGTVDFRGYARFDLSSLGPVTITGASLKWTISGGASRNDVITAGRYATYGLNNVAGNTPQDWDEATFVLSSKGSEDVPTLTGVTDLDDNVAGISEVIVPMGSAEMPGTTMTVAGAPQAAFLQSRLADGGLATFILSNDDATDRGFGLATKENVTEAYRPMLTIEYVPEPATLVLVGLALAAASVARRRAA